MSEPTLPLGLGQLAVATALVLIPAVSSALLRLGLGRQIVISTVRAIVQLLAIGYLLTYVFGLNRPWAVLLVGLLMLLAAGHTALTRTRVRYRGIYFDTFFSLATAAAVMLAVAVSLVVQADPWWTPRYLIPILGMLLGNTLTGLSLGLSVWLENTREQKDRIESLLAVGATRWEAAREGVATALRLALTPILNATAAAGIVSLPGMMTGQILAGNPPGLAVRYQIVILFLISATTALGTMTAVGLAYWRLFDDRHRLRLDRLR